MKTRNNVIVPKVAVDNSLDHLKDRKFAMEKLERANEFIAKHGLPKEYYLSQGLTPPDSTP
ncbi:hypothetical protein SAMN05216327_105443 [Dyadobacter sp. SG02]|uniref:hypothetical protein n=1 Tax=Dyadobacter sp. SG02 TaxID=1855291 RepID=UPI0008B0AEB9|nr:hypothetical protein [Dyadobacter sp. SG02]SEJ04454.1 hypothetical protein SAMN05216327_105443 [Dyadobacter sp. SG02]